VAQPLVESKIRDRIAHVAILSLVIGWSAVVTFQMSTTSQKVDQKSALMQAASVGPGIGHASKPRMAEKIANASANESQLATTIITPTQFSLQPNGHLVIAANDILLTDHNRVRVGDLPFAPAKQALMKFQKPAAMPTVTLTAAADIPEHHVEVVRKFMERYYGWSVVTTTSSHAGTFELEIAPSQEGVK
jgi:hypothetical protein